MTHPTEPVGGVGDETRRRSHERNTAAWQSVLDSLERRLQQGEEYADAAKHALDHGNNPGPAPDLTYQPPEALGPVPPELITAARDLLRRQQAVSERLQITANRVREQRDTTQAPSAAATPALYIDLSI